MKKRILIGAIALLLVVGLVLPMDGMSQASTGDATLTLNYNTSAGSLPNSLSVNVSRSAPFPYNQTRTWFGGATVTFSGLQSGYTYTVSSTLGGATRTDTVTVVAGENSYNVPCAALTVNWRTGTGDLSSVHARILVTGGGEVVRKDYASPSSTFPLLQTDGTFTYDVRSIKGPSTRTDTIGELTTNRTFDVPCADLTVTWYGNGNPAWGMTGVHARIRVVGGGEANVDMKDWASPSWTFRLLQTQGDTKYSVVSIKGATRTDIVGALTTASTTFAVPCVRFQVMVVGANFALRPTPFDLRVLSGATTVDMTNSWVNLWDVSLLASSPVLPGSTGAGPYTFRATRGGTTAGTTAAADPPPGLAGVILMLP